MPAGRHDLTLLIRVEDHPAEIQTRLSRALTSVGSEPAADLRVPGLPARWAVVQREDDRVRVRLLGKDEAHELAAGQTVRVGGVSLTLKSADTGAPGLPIQSLVDRLSDVERPREALGMLLTGILEATGADHGAIILREDDDYTVTVARSLRGGSFDDARELLSDHIVRDVLASGERVWVQDTDRHERFARVPSVVSLKLRSVLCVPMQLHGSVLGAIFLGKRDLRKPLNQRQAEDLGLLASMAVPLLVQLRRAQPGTGPAEAIIVGECEGIHRVRALIERVAPSDLSVLIQGETGTGKELVARAIHAASPRAEQAMVSINCSAVPESLLEAELFGSKRGAFTGAVSDRKGRIEQAHDGTLFLDEIGDMPLPMQAALLRVLEAREVTRLGENQARPVDFRLLSATHKDLEAEVETGRFRKDLFYRLCEFVIEVPPLAGRAADILLLAQLFLRQAERQLGLPAHRIGQAATRVLLSHAWPGNVRELRATMRRSAILCDADAILPAHLSLAASSLPRGLPAIAPGAEGGAPGAEAGELGDLSRPLSEARDAFVSRYVAAVIDQHEGDREEAARSLVISIRSLYRYLSVK